MILSSAPKAIGASSYSSYSSMFNGQCSINHFGVFAEFLITLYGNTVTDVQTIDDTNIIALCLTDGHRRTMS